MSKLYASVDSDTGNTVTKTGHGEISAHVRGWNHGVRVHVTTAGDKIQLVVERTGGSNNPGTTAILHSEVIDL
jgi:hypothetical protein